MSGILTGALSLLSNVLNPYDTVIHPCSWRGLTFICTELNSTPNRNTAVHVYPYSASGYPSTEDLGQAAEYIDIRGYLASATLSSPSQVYGSVETNFRKTLQTLFGPGILVHPTLGPIKAVCLNASMGYSADKLGIINLAMRFVVVDPASATINAPIPNTQTTLQSYVSNALSSVTSSISGSITTFLASGVGLAVVAGLTVAAYVATAVEVCTDAASVGNEAQGLGFITDDTVTLGRYSSGSLTQAPAALAQVDTTQPMPTILANGLAALRSAQVTSVASVTSAVTALEAAAAGLSVATLSTFTSAVTSAVQAIAAAPNSPADQIRVLSAMAVVNPNLTQPGAALIGNLIAWTALIALANTLSNYQPTSSTDAENVLASVTPLYQAAISTAANVPDYQSFAALEQVYAGVWNDLTTRGSLLPPLITWSVPADLPACTVAQLIYQDGSREDDLILRVNPVHPLFCPATFTALSY